MISLQYNETVEARQDFEGSLVHFNEVFRGSPIPESENGEGYAAVAQKFIREIEAASNLLPKLGNERDDLIAAIADLNRYYSEGELPTRNTEEWMRLYGEFRIDYDDYINSRAAYFSELADEAGNYWRYLTNS